MNHNQPNRGTTWKSVCSIIIVSLFFVVSGVTFTHAETVTEQTETNTADAAASTLPADTTETITSEKAPESTSTPAPSAVVAADCTLSTFDFYVALTRGQISYTLIALNGDGTSASLNITNHSSCTAEVSFASYKMFTQVNEPQWLSTQVLVGSTGLVKIAVGATQTLTVPVPSCKVQLDAYFGLAPAHLLDSNPYDYPNNPFVFTWLVGSQPVCTNTPPGGGGGTATNTAPTITLTGANPIVITVGGTFTDPGATATDTEDGNLTSHIMATGTVNTNVIGSYTITYSVTDSGGLGATTTRTVTVQSGGNGGGGGNTNTAPVIDILGTNPITIDLNTPYTDAGASSTDAEDGDLTSHIMASSSVSTTTVGTYTVVYTVTDSGGLTATATRTVNVVDPSVTPPGGGGGNGGGGGGGGGPNIGIGGGFGGAAFAAGVGGFGATLQDTGLQCPLLRDFLRYGQANDPSEVVKLQAFLKRMYGYDIDVNGLFDEKTLAGVNAFQTTFLGEVMGPWGATQPSGYVYITTKKKINQIACDTAFIINSSEQAIIDAYKAGQSGGTLPDGSTPTTTGPDIGISNGSSSVALNDDFFNNPNTAGAANASILARFWNFLKNLFHIGG